MLYDSKEYERVVFAEVVIPDRPNTYGDIHTPKQVKDIAYGFMKAGIGDTVGIDVDHDNEDLSGSIKVIESFIAREGDPDFIEGSWVVGLYIGDDSTWNKVLDGDITGYSYEACMYSKDAEIEIPIVRTVAGFTAKDVIDDHFHTFLVVLDMEGNVLYGSTNDVDSHTHSIMNNTYTEYGLGHSHRYNIYPAGE